MLFGKKIDRAFRRLHEEKEDALNEAGENQEEMPELEKNDFLAMVLAAILVIGPAALGVLGILALAGYLFFFH